MLKKNLSRALPLVLIISAIALSPSFSMGKIGGERDIEIRVEDILILILALIWIINFLISGKGKIEKAPLFFPILLWLGFSFFTTVLNWMLLSSRTGIAQSSFFLLKEVQFFLFYFYFFYRIKTLDTARFLIKLWIFLGLANVGYVLYQVITGLRTGEYGTAAISERGVFPTGAFFLLFFIFFVNIFLYYFLDKKISPLKKGILGILVISPAIGVFGSDSKTNFAGFILALFLTLLLLSLRKRVLKLFLTIMLISIILIATFFLALKRVPDAVRLLTVLSPKELLFSYEKARVEPAIKYEFEQAMQRHPLFILLGVGKGYGETHNQYLRNLVETGIIGSLIFLILIFAIIKRSFEGFAKSRDGLSIGLSAGLLISTLTLLLLSFATEPFLVVKPSEVYWVFTAITMAVLIRKKDK